MNTPRIIALVLTAGLLLLLATAACGQKSSSAVADNPAAIAPAAPTRPPAATPTPAPSATLAPAVAPTAAPTSGASAPAPVAKAPTMSPDDTVSSADPTLPPEPTPMVPDGMAKVPAPIESVEIIVAESFPPQYFAHVVSGLPNGCVEFYGYEETREGNTVTITVTNLEPAPSNNTLACAAIYLTHEAGVALGTDFMSGETYTLKVNGVVATFVAQ